MTRPRADADEWLQRLGLEVLWRDLQGLEESVRPPVIMLRSSLAPCEKRWATFHAISHVLLHRGNQLRMVRDGRRQFVRKQERQAEAWTARLLVPLVELEPFVVGGVDEEELADTFDVPPAGLRVALGLLLEQQALLAGLEEQGTGVRLLDGEPPWPKCCFCNELAEDIYETRSEASARLAGWVQRSPLCTVHRRLLSDAGERGRVYAADGTRYWIVTPPG